MKELIEKLEESAVKKAGSIDLGAYKKALASKFEFVGDSGYSKDVLLFNFKGRSKDLSKAGNEAFNMLMRAGLPFPKGLGGVGGIKTGYKDGQDRVVLELNFRHGLAESLGEAKDPEAKDAFKALEKQLRKAGIPADEQDRKYRTNVDPDEFMFMGIGDSPKGKVYQFKHRGSRNYLWVVVKSGELVIPKGGAFHKGAFPALESMSEAESDGIKRMQQWFLDNTGWRARASKHAVVVDRSTGPGEITIEEDGNNWLVTIQSSHMIKGNVESAAKQILGLAKKSGMKI